MDTGALASSSAAESEEVSKGSSEVEDSPSAESGPAHSGLAKGGTGGRSGTAAGTKRKPEVGPTPPRSKTKKKRTFTPAGQTFRQAEADNLLGVVLVQDHPYTVLSRVQFERVCERLLQSIEAAIDFGNWIGNVFLYLSFVVSGCNFKLTHA